jgi:TRAP-type transport system periplasmic protein
MSVANRLLQCLAGAVLAVAALGDVAAHGVSLDFHHAVPESSAFHKGFLLPWVEKVERDAGGRIRFHPHAASTLGGDPEGLYAKAADGDADVVWVPVRPSTTQFGALAVFTLPFTVHHAQGGSRAVSEFVRVNDLQDRDFDGVRVIAAHVGDGAQLHWAKAADAGADPAGRRIAAGSAVEAAVLTAMGASASVMTTAQMADGLKSGALDAVLLPWEQAASSGLDRTTQAHVEFGPDGTGLASSTYVLAMSTSSFRALADDLKAAVNANSGIETAAWLGRVLDVAAASARKAAVVRGDVVRTVTAEELVRWRQAAAQATAARLADLEKAGVRVRPLLDSARERLQEFDKPR